MFGALRKRNGNQRDRYPRGGTLNRKIIAFFLIVGIVPAIVISIYYSFSMVAIYESSIVDGRMVALRSMLSRFDTAMDSLREFTDWVFLDKDIKSLLTNAPEDLEDYRERILDSADNITYHVSFSRITDFLSSVFLFGNNGLDLRYSNTSPAYVIRKSDLLQHEWTSPDRSEYGRPRWIEPVEPLHVMYEDEYLVPMVRSILDLDSSRILGTLIVLINERIFNEIYADYGLIRDELLLFVYPSGIIFASNAGNLIGRTVGDTFPMLDKSESRGSPYTVYFNDGKHFVASTESHEYGWKLVNLIPMVELRQQREDVFFVALFVLILSILLTVLLSMFLTSNINRPIHALIRKVEAFSVEEIPGPAGHRTKNEIGLLEESIDMMSARIGRLMEDKIAEERQKHEIELRLLQSQINPHFLYNTFSVIKWMAMIQGADAIANMVTAMSKILKYAIGKLSEEVRLGDELDMLDEYVKIHQIAGKYPIEFVKHVQDESLFNCSIMKFILQPIVENAIIHGLKPGMSDGRIELHVIRAYDMLYIEISDDGMGISAEKLSEIRALQSGHTMESTKTVGLANIEKRIRLYYGERYGLDVTSEFGKYTKVTVRLPISTANELRSEV